MTNPQAGTARSGWRNSVGPIVPLIPFFTFALIFLFVPTLTVIIGAFQAEGGGLTMSNVRGIGSESALRALRGSIFVSSVSAIIGASAGAVLAYYIAATPPTSLLRRTTMAVSGVLAQFGGVTLAFSFIAAYSYQGVITVALRDNLGVDIFGTGWMYGLWGLTLVYTFFQIPLMVIVFLPAMEGVRPQWREAAVSLGATTRQYWLQVAVPLLRPAFLGCALLLFANAFAAYATAAALVTQGSFITPLLIRSALISETALGQERLANALALEMVIVVVIVMSGYTWLLRRTSRWLG